MTDHGAESSPDERRTYELRMRVADEPLTVRASVPTAPVRVADLLPIIQGLGNITVDAATSELGKSGREVSCRAGCGACCRQIVPVSPSEARYLAEHVASLPEAERDAYVRRFREALETFEQAGLLERLRRIHESKDPAEKRAFGIEYFRAGVACPFLIDESCSIHPHRPLACREYLVTSPPEHCARPETDQEHIEPVPLPTHPSRILYRFEDGAGDDDARWLPLVRIPEWIEETAGEETPRFPGTAIFEAFLEKLAGSMQPPEGAPGEDAPVENGGADA